MKSMTFEHFSRCWFTELPFVVAWNISYIVCELRIFFLHSFSHLSLLRKKLNQFSEAAKFKKLKNVDVKTPRRFHMLPNYVNSFIKLASNLIFYTIITAEKWWLPHHSKSRSMLSNKTMSDLFRNGRWIVRRISNIVWPLWYRRSYDTNIEFKVLNSNVTWANLSCFWFF